MLMVRPTCLKRCHQNAHTERPEDLGWSSFRHYATGCVGRVEIESEWTARQRERAEGKLASAIEVRH